jgi:hypothetical protein
MNCLQPHPLEVQATGMILSLLFPIFAVKDDAVTERGHQVGVRDSDVASQFCPLQNLRGLKGLPELDDGLGYIREERRRREGKKGGVVCGRDIYPRISL